MSLTVSPGPISNDTTQRGIPISLETWQSSRAYFYDAERQQRVEPKALLCVLGYVHAWGIAEAACVPDGSTVFCPCRDGEWQIGGRCMRLPVEVHQAAIDSVAHTGRLNSATNRQIPFTTIDNCFAIGQRVARPDALVSLDTRSLSEP